MTPTTCILPVSCISGPLSAVNISVSALSSIEFVSGDQSPPLVSQNLSTVTVNKKLGKTYKEGNNYANIYSFFPLRLLKTAV